jgi:hypothetical protein
MPAFTAVLPSIPTVASADSLLLDETNLQVRAYELSCFRCGSSLQSAIRKPAYRSSAKQQDSIGKANASGIYRPRICTVQRNSSDRDAGFVHGKECVGPERLANPKPEKNASLGESAEQGNHHDADEQRPSGDVQERRVHHRDVNSDAKQPGKCELHWKAKDNGQLFVLAINNGLVIRSVVPPLIDHRFLIVEIARFNDSSCFVTHRQAPKRRRKGVGECPLRGSQLSFWIDRYWPK